MVTMLSMSGPVKTAFPYAVAASKADANGSGAVTCVDEWWTVVLPARSMLTAGLFLKEFVPDGVKWAHLDVAGPAFNNGEPHGYTPKGGTGVPVRTLVEWLTSLGA